MPSRSIEEPPRIQVTFANGKQDDFELFHYKTNENVERGCNYLGHLRNDLSSNVAVTGCLSNSGDHLEITILSPSSVNKMFKVDYDQNTEIIKNPFEDGGTNPIHKFQCKKICLVRFRSLNKVAWYSIAKF